MDTTSCGSNWSRSCVTRKRRRTPSPGPIVTVEIDTETYKARAHPIRGAERDRLYAQHATVHASFNEYDTKTSRVIPLVGLERLAENGAPSQG